MQLPVSGWEVEFHAPDGNDELAILDVADGAVSSGLMALSRLAQVAPAEDGAVPIRHGVGFWASLSLTDYEAALLALRRFLLGDTVSCLLRDNSHRCGARMELEFSISQLLHEVKPRMARGVRQDEQDSHRYWLADSSGQALRFRLPTVRDQLTVQGDPGGAALLLRRCIDEDSRTAHARARVERAMEAMAPLVSRDLTGSCPDCGEPVSAQLHVASLVMEEWRLSAAHVHEEIHAIAVTYHWDEATILAMPQRRRAAYVETIRQQSGGRA